MQPPSLLLITSSAVQCLSPSDQVILANVFNAYEKTCIAAKNAKTRCLVSTQCTSLHEYITELSYEFQSCIEYLKHIPEFANIIMDDKVRLLKNHFGVLVSINRLMMQPLPLKDVVITWTNVFGIDITQRILTSNQLLEAYIHDPVMLKLLIIVLVLSSSNGRNLSYIDIDQICDDPLAIFAAQNVYVDLLWRYILSRSASEANAVKFFNKLIMCVLYIKNLDMDIDVYVSSLSSEIKKMDPVIQNMWPTAGEVEDVTDVDPVENIIL